MATTSGSHPSIYFCRSNESVETVHPYGRSQVSNLGFIKINFDSEVKALQFLSSLPDNWDGLVITVSNSLGSSPMKYDDMVSVILSEEVCKKIHILRRNFRQCFEYGRKRKKMDNNKDLGRSVSRGKSRSGKSRVEC